MWGRGPSLSLRLRQAANRVPFQGLSQVARGPSREQHQKLLVRHLKSITESRTRYIMFSVDFAGFINLVPIHNTSSDHGVSTSEQVAPGISPDDGPIP